MSNEYTIYLEGHEWDIRDLWHNIKNMAQYKENNAKDFGSFLGMRKNWFGLLLLPKAVLENHDAITLYVNLVDEKDFHKVYVQEIYKDNIKGVWALRFSYYGKADITYVYKRMSKILKIYNLRMLVG